LSEHERFEELASLAAVGELSSNEMEEFLCHKQTCRKCAEIESATASLATAAFLAGSPNEEHVETEVNRHRRAREAVARRLPVVIESPLARRYKHLAAAGIAAAFLLGTGVGMSVEARRKSVPDSIPQSAAALPVAKEIPSTQPSGNPPVAAPQVKAASALEGRLRDAHMENHELGGKLAASEQRAVDLAQQVRDIERQSNSRAREAIEARNEASEVKKELTQARDSVAKSQATIDSLRYQLTDREARLAEVTASSERERELLSAGREIRDIMGARDLHIVDVVDRDGKGRTRKAFGRAFYTQGKSLIFYAFDLPLRNTADGKYVYTAWGSNSNNMTSRAARSLGIFYNDDQTQHRWAMKFDDPKVLEQIDTVFVTLEPSGLAPKVPTGKPLLEAYFGTPPNHP
jgi:hypothetical protein